MNPTVRMFFALAVLASAALTANAVASGAEAATPDVVITADKNGLAGLAVRDPGKSRVVIRNGNNSPLVRLWGLSKDAKPAEVPEISVRLPDSIETKASGHQVTVSILARRPPGSANKSFAATYATNEVGNAGWRTFDLSDQMQRFEFTYDVKPINYGNGDYVAFLPDIDGTGGAIDVGEISVTVGSASTPAAGAPAQNTTAPQPVAPVAGAQPLAVAPAPPQPSEPQATPPSSSPPGNLLTTAYYDVKLSRLMARVSGQRGGIAILGDGLLYGTKKGRLFYIPDLSDLWGKSIVELAEQPPFNLSSPKLSRMNDSTLTILGVGAEKNERAGPNAWDIYESMVEFDDRHDCVFIGLWQAQVTLVGRTAPSFDKGWQRIFRANPCIPLWSLSDSDALWETGGRIDFDQKGIIFSIGLGEFGEVVGGKKSNDPLRSLGQIDESDYGKIVRIDRKTHGVTHIAKGFRNPEGLYVDRDGTIFETEHGPEGGDEVNVIEQGKNYGWPVVTFGTEYGKKAWRYDSGPEAQSKFIPPIFAFVPSVGPSEIVRVHGEEFARWKGDLLMTSLSGGSSGTSQGLRLFRLHYVDGRILFSEPIYIGKRMRDIIEAPDGKLIISTDGGEMFILSDAAKDSSLTASQVAAAPATLPQPAPQQQDNASADTPDGGAVFAEKCSSCHGLQTGNQNARAPALGCIFNSNVASTDIYSYSLGLKQKASIKWDANNLAAFLKDPKTWAPGTRMEAQSLSAGQSAALLAFLSTKPGQNCH